MEEIWKKIEGYYNYSVSSDGEVRNDTTGRILKKCKNKGYEKVTLYKNGERKTVSVHRLVAIAFIPNPLELPCIDHINTIRNDNRVSNLKWCTQKENCNNPLTLENYSESMKGEKHPMYGKQHTEEAKEKMSKAHKGENNYNARKVILLNTGENFTCIKQASEKYKVDQSSISKCCRGVKKSAGKDKNGNKLVWQYYDEYLERLKEGEDK